MNSMRAHLIFYKDGDHPQAIIFQNRDGSWGMDGEVEHLLGLTSGKGKTNAEGSCSKSDEYYQLKIEAAYYEDKFEICRKALEELRDMHKQAANILDLALFQVKDLTPGEEAGPSAPMRTEVVDISDDGRSKDDVSPPTGPAKRRPYTRSRAAKGGNRGRGRKA